MLPNFDAVGLIQTILISVIGWIGVRVEHTLTRLRALEDAVRDVIGSVKVLETRHTDDQKANERRLEHTEDDVRYLIRKPERDENDH